MALAATGIGSNLDVTGIISQLMALEQRPLTLLAQKQATIQSKISAFGAVKGAFSTIQTSAQALAKADIFASRKATIADAGVATVAASTTATPGNFTLEVSSLARAQVTASTAFASSSTTVGSGTLTIELGTYSGGNFTVNPAKTPVTVTIDSGAATLSDVRDAINAADAGVTASLINDGSGSRLVLTSEDGGTANTVRISAVDDDGLDTDDAGLSKLIYNAATGGVSRMSQVVSATDAQLTVNGIAVTSSSNTLTDMIEGVTLTLKSTNVGSPTTLTVGTDFSGAKAAVEKLVKSYNDAILTIKNQTAYNSTTKTGAALNGESTVQSVRTRLSSLFTGEIAPGVSLASIGVSVQKDGTLAINAEKLTTALENGSAKNLFIGSTGVTGLAAKVESMVKTVIDDDGLIDNRTDGLDASIKSLDSRKTQLNLRLEQIEARYRRQFTALDSLVSSMNTTSSFLAQQLANLPTYSS